MKQRWCISIKSGGKRQYGSSRVKDSSPAM